MGLGLTWLDWTLVVLVLLFAIGGFLRGTIAQVFVVLGLLIGAWSALFVSSWVGAHWHGARPDVVFVALRWLVAALAGLAVAALFQWWGDGLGRAVREGPLGWLDRGGGIVLGATLGVTVGSLILLAALTIQHPSAPGVVAARARVTAPVMGVGAGVCSLSEAYLPGSGWLKQRFLAAKRRAVHIRESGSRSRTS